MAAAATLDPNSTVGITGFDEDDRSGTRWAFAIAVVLHAILFSLHLPGLVARATEPERPREYVVIADKFAPPPPQEQERLPELLAKRVPIPDPTPEGPEMVRPAERIETPIDFHVGDVLVGIPEAPPAAEQTGPLRVGGEVLAPIKIHTPSPRYPELARRVRKEGVVIVEAIIDETGTVASTRVIKSAPMGLDDAAVEAVSKWRFEPATLRGQPVPVLFSLTVKFQLN